ncbi:hypothetical protein [Clostridium intestinale]|uniref:hypothetical protein n=1 Tax=Clostridium intestinale TaxID=36845 RepID=UPI002DD666E9|nr:hypothetical protein [Clostridium intestinale]WRY50718.1 hypothetical protein P8F83_18930 [Clostridium intestinale]
MQEEFKVRIIGRESKESDNYVTETLSKENNITDNKKKLDIVSSGKKSPISFGKKSPISFGKKSPISFGKKGEKQTIISIEDEQRDSHYNRENNAFTDLREREISVTNAEHDRITKINANVKEEQKNQNLIYAFSENDEIKFIKGYNGHLYIRGGDREFELCNFIILPVKIIIRDNGVDLKTVYKMKCILENGDEEKEIYISNSDLNDFKWIGMKLGVKYYISAQNDSYALLKIYISKSFKDTLQEYKYDMIGWRFVKGKYVYLHGGGAIGMNNSNIKGEINKIIEINNSLNPYDALKNSLTLIDMSRNKGKTVPLFLYAHLSVLTQLFISCNARPQFTLWIYGVSGSMKTSISKVFFNLFNRSSNKEISSTFKDTQSVVEIKAFEAKDSVLLVDDYHPTTSSTEKKSMEGLASHILRMYGDGITKGRATKNMEKQREYPPRGICVITGEDVLGGESTVARYVGIEVTREDYDTNILRYHQDNPLIFSTHMYHFINWVSCNYQHIKSQIDSKFAQHRNDGVDFFRHKRFGECLAIFNLISDIFLKYCCSIGYLDSYSAGLIANDWNDVIIDTIKLHEDNSTNQDPAIMYLIAIDELIRSNRCILLEVGQTSSTRANIIGYRDDSYYYLIPETSYNNVKSFWKNQGVEFPIGKESTHKALDKLNVIETVMESGKVRRTVKCTLDGNRTRYLKIDRNIVSILLNK